MTLLDFARGIGLQIAVLVLIVGLCWRFSAILLLLIGTVMIIDLLTERARWALIGREGGA